MGKLESLFLYLIVYTISALLLSLSKKNKGKKIDFWFVIAVLIPVLLAALRDNVGTDFENYGWIFEGQSQLSFSDWYETNGMYIDGTPFGIWLISKISYFFNSRELYFGILSLLVVAPAFLFIKKELPQNICFLSAFLFLTGTFTTGLNITKQCVAVAFIIYGIRYVHERKLLRFLLMILCAYCFHPSSLVAVFIYFIWTKEDTKYSVKRIIVVFLTVVFVLSISRLLEAVGGRFASYTEAAEVEFSNRTFFVDLMWCVLFLLYRKKYAEFNPRNDLLITLFLVGLIMTVSGFVSPFIKRIAMYYTFPKEFLIVQLPIIFIEEDKPVVNALIFVYAIAIFVISFYVLGQADIIPYQFVGG